jgi:hypothetical protein
MALNEAGETTLPFINAFSQVTRSYTLELKAPAAKATERSQGVTGRIAVPEPL